MPLPTDVIEALSAKVVYIRWFAWLDVLDDPARAVSGIADKSFAPGETGDPDLDGHTFLAISANLIDIEDPQHSSAGSDALKAKLRGLPLVNADMNDVLDNRPRYYKREARLWYQLLDPQTHVPIGGVNRYYSGYMTRMSADLSREEQAILVEIQNFRATLSQARGKTYLHQADFDPGDKSAGLTISAANGMEKAGISGRGRGGGGNSGGSRAALTGGPRMNAW